MILQQIDIPVIDYKGTKILPGTLPEIIILHPTYIEHKWKIKLNRDEDGVAKEKFFQGKEYIRKTAINCVSAYYNGDDEAFNVEVIIGNRATSLTLVFPTMGEAVAFQDKIVLWLDL